MKILYTIGLGLSALVGLWHFTVPYLFQWYSYIPSQYKNLIVGIDWTNFFFSLLLAGYSIILMFMRKKAFNRNREVLIMYGFMVFVWLCRVLITFIEPWPLEPVMWAAYGQQIAAFVIFLLQLIPFVFLLGKKR
jgi:hypothetical protein